MDWTSLRAELTWLVHADQEQSSCPEGEVSTGVLLARGAGSGQGCQSGSFCQNPATASQKALALERAGRCPAPPRVSAEAQPMDGLQAQDLQVSWKQ